MRWTRAVLGAVCALAVTAGPASAALDVYFDAPPLQGESAGRGHEKQIDILAFAFGVSRDKGRPIAQDVSITKYVDTASPPLLELVASGQTLPSATVSVNKAGEKPFEVSRYCFTGVRFTSLSAAGSGGENRLTEKVSFSYERIIHRYTTQKADGTTGGPVFGGWDFVDNLRYGPAGC